MNQEHLPTLSRDEFKILAEKIREISGLSLSENKEYLVRQRLAAILRNFNCQNFRELIDLLNRKPDMVLRDQIISAMVTSETSFFRDQKPFDLVYQKFFPRFMEEKQLGPVNLLSAGVATGEEIYSLSVLVHEFCAALPKPVSPVSHFAITGLDISSRAIECAKAGVFSETQINRGLKNVYKNQYFSHSGESWVAKDNLKKIMTFRRYNLVSSIPFGVQGTFDLIFCRNVLIYFEESDQKKVLKNFYQLLSNRGILILGSSEVINPAFDVPFKPGSQGGCLFYTKDNLKPPGQATTK